jgi:hypothetical protein
MKYPQEQLDADKGYIEWLFNTQSARVHVAVYKTSRTDNGHTHRQAKVFVATAPGQISDITARIGRLGGLRFVGGGDLVVIHTCIDVGQIIEKHTGVKVEVEAL